MNPLLGRWISADPLAVHAPGEADLNLYAYVHGQILKNIDPLGLRSKEAQAKIDSHEAEKAQVEAVEGELSTQEAMLEQEIAENSYLAETEAVDQEDYDSRQEAVSQLKQQLGVVKQELSQLREYWAREVAVYKEWRVAEERHVLIQNGLPGSGGIVVKQEDVEEHKSMKRLEVATQTIDNIRESGAFGVAAEGAVQAQAQATEGRWATLEERHSAYQTARLVSDAVGAGAVRSVPEQKAQNGQSAVPTRGRATPIKMPNEVKRELERIDNNWGPAPSPLPGDKKFRGEMGLPKN